MRYLVIFLLIFVFQSWSVLSAALEDEIATEGSINQIPRLLNEVQNKFEMGEYSAALNLLEEILKIDQENAEAHAKIGVILVRIGHFHEGVEHLKKATVLSPDNISYYQSLAHSYEFKSFYDNAILTYNKIIALAVPESSAYKLANKKIDFLTATKLARSGSLDKAVPIFDQLVRRYPDDPVIRYSLGLSYFFLNKMDQAEVEFHKVIISNPRHTSTYLNLASISESRGDMSKAIEHLETVVSLSPESAHGKKAKERLGLIEANLIAASGNHHDALVILNDVIDMNPESVFALILMGRSYGQIGKVASAEESYQKVLALVPGHLEAKSQLAGLYLMSKRIGLGIDLLENILIEGKGTKYAVEAEKALKNISGEQASGEDLFGEMSKEDKAEMIEAFLLDRISKNSKDVEAYFKLSQFYMQIKRKDDAYEAISKAAEFSPFNEQIFRVKGAIADELGNYDEAVLAYSRAIMLTVDVEKADILVGALRLVVAKQRYSEGKLGISERAFKEIIVDMPDNVVAYFYLGSIYMREESYLKAVDSYENVVRLSPGNFGARLSLAGTLERLNQEEKAISEYRKILQGNPDEKLADDVKARLFATEKKIKGMTASMGYSVTADDNIVADDTIANSGSELRSDLSFNLSYQYKMKSGLRLRFTTSPTYSVYHKRQYDFLNTSNNISATVTPGRYTLMGGYTKRTSMGLLNEQRSSSSDIFFYEATTRAKFIKLYNIFSGEKIMTDFSLSLSQSLFDSATNSFFSSESLRLSADINQSIDKSTTARLGYNYVINDNTEVGASDYAYRSHQLNLRLERRFESGVTGNISYGYTLTSYVNRDSFTNFLAYRKNGTHNLSGGLNYWMSRKIRLFANYAYVKSISNLGITTSLTSEEISAGRQFQSTSLAGFERNAITAGFNLLF